MAIVSLVVGGLALYLIASTAVYFRLTKTQQGYLDNSVNTPSQIRNISPNYPTFSATYFEVPEYAEVSFNSLSGGIRLSGWYLPNPKSRSIIIIVPGLNSSKASAKCLIPAGMLWHHGHNVLIIDVRDQGTSDIEDRRTALGTTEYLDVLGAVQWAVNSGFQKEHIGLMGGSLGGATALIAFAQDPALKAAFIDSSYADVHVAILEELKRNQYPQFLASGGIRMAQFISGDRLLSKSPIAAIKKVNQRSIMIVHSTKDSRLNVHHAHDLIRAARSVENRHITAWIHHYPGHCDTMLAAPSEYEQRLVSFFTPIRAPRFVTAIGTANTPVTENITSANSEIPLI